MRHFIPWSLVALLSILLLIAAQEKDASRAADPQASAPATRPSGGGAGGPLQDMSARMIEAIRQTPGCLGVETARLSSGKNSIFAFFEDKQAAMRWYNHPMHLTLRGMMPGEAQAGEGHEPMADVPEGVPVLAVASIGFDGPPAFAGSAIPFSSISIELYVPVNGGLRINSGFAPEKFAELMQEKPDPEKAKPR